MTLRKECVTLQKNQLNQVIYGIYQKQNNNSQIFRKGSI